MNSYFSHDSNSRNDEKIIDLRMVYGWEGYGLYWAIIEKLRDATNYRLSARYDLIAFDLRTEARLVESIVNDFDLFAVESDYFYSESLCRRMSIKDAKSEKAREAAKIRWRNAGEKANLQKLDTANPVDEAPDANTAYPGKLFVPPTLQEVEEYCIQQKNGVDALKFISYYESKGWMIGINQMRCWKSAIRTWEYNKKRTETEYEPKNATARLHPALQ